MPSPTDQQLMQQAFAAAAKRPAQPSQPQPALQHGPLAQRRPDRSQFVLGIDRIRPDADQIRTLNKSADDPAVVELAESIRAVGIENPLTVRYLREDDIYELIAGERRFAAARLAGLTEVPVKLVEADETTARRLQLHENVHRANLTPLELATALQTLLAAGETPESLARLLCKSAAYVNKALTVARQLTPAATAIVQADTERFTSLDVLYDIAQTPAEEQPGLLERLQQEQLTREEVRQITAPLKQAAKQNKERPARGRRPRPRGTLRALRVPCGATVNVAFPKPNASDEDISTALEQALEQMRRAKQES